MDDGSPGDAPPGKKRASASGNYKRGKERTARNSPRNRRRFSVRAPHRR